MDKETKELISKLNKEVDFFEEEEEYYRSTGEKGVFNMVHLPKVVELKKELTSLLARIEHYEEY